MTSNSAPGLQRTRRNALAICALMLSSAAVAWKYTPHEKMADLNRDLKLEIAVPKVFGEWQLEESGFKSVVNPQQTQLLDELYSQTLGRTYINASGQRIMLSIAYGKEQAGENQLHRPEVCYVAQGFKLERSGTSSLMLQGRNTAISLQRLMAQQSRRSEPITYWMRVGDDIVASGTDQRVSRVRHGMNGWVPDGILFRVSSLTDDRQSAFILHEKFIADLISAVDPATRRFLIGPVTPSPAGAK